MRYKIKKGGEYAFPPFPLLSIGKKSLLQWKIKFDESAVYSIAGENPSDIQKLCGIGWFPSHHQNSARFGWRYDGKGKIDIMAYCYDKGVRLSSASTEKLVSKVEVGKEYTLQLQILKNGYVFAVLETDSRPVVVTKTFNQPIIGFWLRPYFEAANGAPHDMRFEVTRIK